MIYFLGLFYILFIHGKHRLRNSILFTLFYLVGDILAAWAIWGTL